MPWMEAVMANELQALIDRILAEGPEAVIARLRRQLDQLPAKISRLDPVRRAGRPGRARGGDKLLDHNSDAGRAAVASLSGNRLR